MTREHRIHRLLDEAADFASVGDYAASMKCTDAAHRLLEEERQERFRVLFERLIRKDNEGDQ